MNKQSQTQKRNQTRHAFLLTFFTEDEYTEKEVNGFWLIKQWNGATSTWEVAIYSTESYKAKEAFKAGSLFAEQAAHLRSIL